MLAGGATAEISSASDKLVTSHLRLVVKIATGYRGYGLPLDDLISEGNCGMVQAVKQFDPERGFRLATCAMWWIRAAIAEYVLRSSSLVKIGTTGAQKKLFFNLRKLKGQMQAVQEGDLEPVQVTKIAKALNVPEQEVIRMNRRLTGPDHSLNSPMNTDGTGQWQDQLVDQSETQEEALAEREELGGRRALLARAWTVLNNRERHILTERWLVDNPNNARDAVLALWDLARTRPADRNSRVPKAAEGHESTDVASPFAIGIGRSDLANKKLCSHLIKLVNAVKLPCTRSGRLFGTHVAR